MAGKIFINYRRGDDPGHTGRLFDRLQDVFEPQQLFMDVDNIAPGLDFVRVLNERVAECDIVLAVIGKSWVDSLDPSGARRLEDPEDFVRIEIESALNQGKRVIPVLVGDSQMPHPEDLPEALRPLARRNAVRLTHERFRADVQGLIKALQQGLGEIEAQRQAEAEALRRAQAEEERRRQEAEAARRAEEEAQRKKAELEAMERAEAERRRQEAAATQRAEAERAFTLAKRAGTAAAIDAFLAAHAASPFTEEAQKLKALLRAREDAYRRTISSDDATKLKSFLATYRKGTDVDQVQARLRRLERPQTASPLKPALIIPAALAVVLAAGAAIYWFAIRPAPSTTQVAAVATPAAAPAGASANATLPEAKPATGPSPDKVAWLLLKDTTDEGALKRFMAQYPDSPLRKTAEAQVAALEAAQAAKPAPPSPDDVSWALLKGTTDEGALKRFTAQYPGSPLRKDAEAQIAALEAAQAAKPVPPSPDEIAWTMVKDSKDPDQLQQFVEQFPNSTKRGEAKQRVAALAAEARKSAAANPNDPHELARLVQFELKRVGCFAGTVNGEFDDATRTALHTFAKLASVSFQQDDLSPETVKTLQGIDQRVCPPIRATAHHPDSDERPSRQPTTQKRNSVVDSAAPAPRSNTGGDRIVCGKLGCQALQKGCHPRNGIVICQ